MGGSEAVEQDFLLSTCHRNYENVEAFGHLLLPTFAEVSGVKTGFSVIHLK